MMRNTLDKIPSKLSPYVIILLFLPFTLLGQGGPGGGGGSSYSISGDATADQGDVKNYSISPSTNITFVQWTALPAGSVSINTPSLSATNITFLSSGTVTLYVEMTDNTSTNHFLSKTVTVTQTVPDNPDNPTVSSNGCGESTLSRTGSPPSGVTWFWQGKNSTGTSTTKGSGATFTANEGSGTYYIRARDNATLNWSYGSGSVSVTVPAVPNDPTATMTSASCNGGSATLTASGGGTGATYEWYTSGGAYITSGSTYSPTISSTTTYQVRAKIGSCLSNAVSVQAIANNPTVSVTNGQNTCSNPNSVTLVAESTSIPSNASGVQHKWYTSSTGSSTVSSTHDTNHPVYKTTVTVTANANYWVSVVQDGCESARQQVTATFNSNTEPSIQVLPSDDDLCQPASFSLTASGGGSGAVYEWYTTSTGGSSIHTGATYSPTLNYSDTTNGQKTYYVGGTVTSAMGCSLPVTSREPVTITVLPPVTNAPSVVSDPTCGSGTITLTASGIANATYKWYTSADVYLASGSIYTTTVPGTYKVSATVNGCEGPTANVDAVSNPIPSQATGNSSFARCGTGTVTLTASPGTNADEVHWFSGSSGGTALGVGNSFTTPSIGSNTTYYAESQNSVTGCVASSRKAVQAIINPIPGVATGNSSYARCGTGTVTLSATPGTNADEIHWYSSASGGTTLAIGNDFTTPSISSNTTYYAESQNSATGCIASSRKAVQAVIESSVTWYLDADSDGLAISTADSCDSPGAGYTQTVLPLTDCDDSDGNIGEITWYLDADGDGYAVSTQSSCTYPGAGYTQDVLPVTDCDDTDDTKLGPVIWYLDTDGDGLGDPANPSGSASCDAPSGYVGNSTDLCPLISSATNDCYGNISTDPEDHNYVYTRTYQTEQAAPAFFTEDDNLIQAITFFDGLGRTSQQTAIDQSPDKKDIVTPMEYDSFGRMPSEYLPYATTGTDLGTYRTDALTQVGSFYNVTKYENTQNPFSEKAFEPSPLNRVEKQAAPGNDWAMGQGHEIEMTYGTNTVTDDGVREFRVDLTASGNTYFPDLAENGSYADGELYKNITFDENHDGTSSKLHSTEEFTDKYGRVILKRTYAEVGSPSVVEEHDTYYVYDDLGNLSYVLPPGMDVSSATLTQINSDLDALGYRYVYDYRNRLVEKQLPGKQKEYIVYNTLDQPIMTQDANQRSINEWLFTKYDAFGRVAYTGKAVDSRDRPDIQSEVDTLTTLLWVVQDTSTTSFGGTSVYYDSGAYPTTATMTEVLTINYYDTYNVGTTGAPTSVVVRGTSPQENNTTNVRGLATVSKVKVLTTSSWITTLTYYDKKARPIYTYSENSYLGTVDIVESELDFVGRPVQLRAAHTRGSETVVTLDNFTYDHVGRLLKLTQCIGDETLGYTCEGYSGPTIPTNLVIDNETVTTDQLATNSITVTNSTISPTATLSVDPNAGGSGGAEELIVENTYDELGQLESKKVGGLASATTPLQTVDYTYNVRGWLTGINDDDDTDFTLTKATGDLFGFRIGYNEGSNPLYNGNIALTQWQTEHTDNALKRYDYTYDALNRIIGATDDTGKYNLHGVSYDKMGNIATLKREGWTVASPSLAGNTGLGLMDDMTYSYAGNQLQAVDDANTASATYGFVDGAELTTEYTYDANGNMLTDANKGITGVSYNHLNLPTQVDINGENIQYVYDAAGVKVKKVTSTGIITEYAGNYIYEGSGGTTDLQFFNHPEGYVSPSAVEGQYNHVYQYKDHLGNVRLSYQDINNDGAVDQSEILQERNYYPFGLEHRGYNGNVQGVENNFMTYQSKELDESLGLDWHDFGARMYDAAIGRWMVVDPLAEQTGFPYAAMNNNPIAMIDPTGMSADWVPKLNEDGTTSYIAEEGDSAATLSEQYGIDQQQAEEITGTTGDTEIAEGTEISGEQVEEVTGSDVLKLDLSSKQAKGKGGDQRVFDQFLFARDVAESRGEQTFFAGDFYSNLQTVGTGWNNGLDGIASLTVDGQTFDVLFNLTLQGGNGLGKSRETLSISVSPYRGAQYGTPLGSPTTIMMFSSYKGRNSYSRRSSDQEIGSLPNYTGLLNKRFHN